MLAALLVCLIAPMLQVPNVPASFEGVFKSADKKFVIVQVEGGENMRAYATRSTKYVRDGKPAHAADFHTGEKVVLEAERDVRLNLVATKLELAKGKPSP